MWGFRRRLSARACLLAVLVGPAWVAADTLTVVNAERAATVVVPVGLSQRTETFRAALELSDYVGKITGRALRVVDDDGTVFRSARGGASTIATGAAQIHVGWTSRARETLDAVRLREFDADAFLIRTTADAAFLVGPEDWSTAYACFAFLEELCGVRWFLPGAFGECVPQSGTLIVPLMDRVFEPAYGHRHYDGLAWRNDQELARWRMHRRLRQRFDFEHSLHNVFGAEGYRESFPGLYPVIGGRRRIPGPGSESGWQPCLTHPKAVDIAVQYAKAFFAAHPDAASISLGLPPGEGYCECSRCMRLVDGAAPLGERRTRWYLQFANQVATRFNQVLADKQIGCLLHGQCQLLPRDVKVHPRLVPFLVFPSHRLLLQGGRLEFEQALERLAGKTSEFGLHDTVCDRHMSVPRLQGRQFETWLKRGLQLGARHCNADAYVNWGLDGFTCWLHSRLVWDSTLSVDELMDEFTVRFFGEAAAPMRRYLAAVERCTVTPVMLPASRGVAARFTPVNFRSGDRRQFLSFPPPALAACEAHLDRAGQLAQQQLTRQRVRYFRRGFTVAKMMSLRFHAGARATALMRPVTMLPMGLEALAEGLRDELDVDRFYKETLAADPYCVRYPGTELSGALTRARAKAAGALGEAVVAHLELIDKKACSRGHVDKAARYVIDSIRGSLSDAAATALDQAVAPFVSRAVLCNRRPPPHVDGLLDDRCWRGMPLNSGFVQMKKGSPSAFPTEFRATHDGATLYLAVRCFQDTRRLLAWTRTRDENVRHEDGIEVFLSGADDKRLEHVLHIGCNTQGTIYDALGEAVEWDGQIEVATVTAPEFYTVELAIPLKRARLGLPQQRFARFNVMRNVYARLHLGGGRAEERSAWFLTPNATTSSVVRGWLVFNP